MKISKTQLEVLKELNKELGFIHVNGHLDVNFFFNRSMKTVRGDTVWALVDKGLAVDTDRDDYRKRKIVISDAGKKFLSELA
jgi:hypothetical protein